MWLAVIYKESSKNDGFVITALVTTRVSYFLRKEVIWKKQSVSFDYDKGADVMYISFKKGQAATDTEMINDDILVRKKKALILWVSPYCMPAALPDFSRRQRFGESTSDNGII